MGGSRHSKNAGTMGSEAQTYHERKALGYGTVCERLGKVRTPVHVLAMLPAVHAVTTARLRISALGHTSAPSRVCRTLPATLTTAASRCSQSR